METGEKSDPLIDSDEDDDAPGTAGGMAGQAFSHFMLLVINFVIDNKLSWLLLL